MLACRASHFRTSPFPAVVLSHSKAIGPDSGFEEWVANRACRATVNLVSEPLPLLNLSQRG